MFATQQHVDATPDFGKKRLREEDEQLNQPSSSFAEHRNKRVQCLPLRPSTAEQQWPPPMTPVQSECDDQPLQSHFSPYSSSPAVGEQSQEMDMGDIGSVTSQQLAVHDSTGRMPTPIQPSFAAQVRSRHCEWVRQGSETGSPNGVVNMGHHQTGFSNDQSVPRAMTSEANWQSIQTHRRLPSPISETDDCLPDSTCSPGMIVDGGCDHSQLSAQLENSSLSHPSPPSHTMDHPNAMEVEAQPAESDEDPSSSSPNRRGHVRSKHTINNWTLQPGMKKSFSIGFRSDCEKCRLKVPGHFNHIIIS